MFRAAVGQVWEVQGAQAHSCIQSMTEFGESIQGTFSTGSEVAFRSDQVSV